MLKRSLYSLVLLICAFSLSFCGKPKQPDYIDFQHLNIKKASLDKSVITFDLRYFNPNNFRMQLKEAAVDVYFNDKFVGKSVLDSLIHIPARDTFLIPVSMQVQMKSLLTNAMQLLLNPDVMVKLNGNARLGKGGIFLNVPISYEGKQRIDILGRDSVSVR
ncbi:MAG: LEA type 2 family protein [Chitinophagaceae bacterium]